MDKNNTHLVIVYSKRVDFARCVILGYSLLPGTHKLKQLILLGLISKTERKTERWITN